MAVLIDWESSESHIMGTDTPKLPQLPAHIWICSSGTSKKKWIALSKEAFLTSAKAVNDHLEVTKEDRWLQPLPNHHVGGLSVWARSFLSGCKVVDYPDVTRQRWDPSHYYQTLINSDATLSSIVPTQLYDLIVEERRSPQRLRAIIIGGDYLPKPLYQKAKDLGWPVIPTYGCTESCSQIATGSINNPLLKMLPHIEARVSSTLHIKSKALLTYVFDGDLLDPKVDGWFDTGDTVTFNGEYITPQGRFDDQVKIGGEKVLLGPLRQLLSDLANGLNVSIEITDDDRLGKALQLIGEGDDDLVDIQKKFNYRVPPFAALRKIKIVDSIKRNDLGKLVKNCNKL